MPARASPKNHGMFWAGTEPQGSGSAAPGPAQGTQAVPPWAWEPCPDTLGSLNSSSRILWDPSLSGIHWEAGQATLGVWGGVRADQPKAGLGRAGRAQCHTRMGAGFDSKGREG